MPSPKVRIITNSVSEGAAALGAKLEELGINVSRVRISAAPKRPVRTNVKWGCFNLDPTDFGGDVLNVHSGDQTLNKLTCFGLLHGAGVPVPEFTTSLETAQGWFEGVRAGRMRVYERTVLRGSEGAGINVIEDPAQLSAGVPLYVKGMRGLRREYRVHVFMLNGVRRVFVQQKKRRQGFAEAEGYTNTVRNLAGGWIFAHNDIVTPRQQTLDIAVAACTTFGLTFGAVDVIEMDDLTQGSVVLEINCAPGLMGATCEFYAQAIHDGLTGVNDTPALELTPGAAPLAQAYMEPNPEGDDDYEDEFDHDEY